MKTFKAVILGLRPKQWTKNLTIFAGILFSQNIFDVNMLLAVVAAFLIFCLLSGSIYIINDIADVTTDRKHPVKCKRPIASGELSIKTALLTATALAIACLCAAFYLGPYFFMTALGYLLLQLAYTLYFKYVVILLSLFLGFSKRRHELESLEGDAHLHRKVLGDYSVYFLDQMISVVTASTVICYALYTMSAETISKFGTSNLILTVPFVLYGIFRYLYLIHIKGEGGNPENALVSDIPLIIDIVLWAVTAGFILYV